MQNLTKLPTRELRRLQILFNLCKIMNLKYDDICYNQTIVYTVLCDLVRDAAAVMTHQDQSNLGREGFDWLIIPHHCSSLK